MPTLQTGTFFKPELIKDLFSKVQGKSVLASLSQQKPIPFNGTEQMVFNLEGNAQIVGEGKKKEAGEAKLESVIIKPLKLFIKLVLQTNSYVLLKRNKLISYQHSLTDLLRKLLKHSILQQFTD